MIDCNKKLGIITRVHGSLLIKQFLSDQNNMTKQPDIKVELDVTIRWNSTYDMIRIALRLPRALTALSNHLVKVSTETILDDHDWDTALSNFY
jgi:hypothetical protein